MANSPEAGLFVSSPEAWKSDYEAAGGVARLAPPPRSLLLAASAVAGAAAVALAVWLLLLRAVDKLDTTHAWETGSTIGAIVFASLATLLLVPAVHSVVLSLRARTLEANGKIVAARRVAAHAREKALRTFGFAFAAVIVLAALL